MRALLILLTAAFLSEFTFAQVPDCLNIAAQKLPIDNAGAINLKKTTKNGYHGRAHIAGNLTKIYSDATNHKHMQVTIGTDPGDTIEVIYNEDFGPVPALRLGETIEACGDYITSNAPSGHMPASRDGAVVHWVHKSPNPNHPSGFIVVDGTLCGWSN
jgi:hypothetical protein